MRKYMIVGLTDNLLLQTFHDNGNPRQCSEHEPRPLAIKMSKVQITDDCGSLYNQGGGADIMTGNADDFYSSFTPVEHNWPW